MEGTESACVRVALLHNMLAPPFPHAAPPCLNCMRCELCSRHSKRLSRKRERAQLEDGGGQVEGTPPADGLSDSSLGLTSGGEEEGEEGGVGRTRGSRRRPTKRRRTIRKPVRAGDEDYVYLSDDEEEEEEEEEEDGEGRAQGRAREGRARRATRAAAAAAADVDVEWLVSDVEQPEEEEDEEGGQGRGTRARSGNHAAAGQPFLPRERERDRARRAVTQHGTSPGARRAAGQPALGGQGGMGDGGGEQEAGGHGGGWPFNEGGTFQAQDIGQGAGRG